MRAGNAFLESLPENTPISPYAASKKAAGSNGLFYHYLFGMDISVVDISLIYIRLVDRHEVFRFIMWIDEVNP
jgi:nucleoside-diphosphate-sugar epimerase